MINRFKDFVGGITTCYKYIQKIKNMEMTEFGLKGTHMMCLFFLYQNPEGLTAVQLCQLCAEDKAAISRTIATLKNKGYIESGEKKYRATLTLTQSGTDIAKKLDGIISQWVGFGGGGVSNDDRDTFYRVLGQISNNLRENMESKN